MDNSEISDNTKIIYDPIHKVIELDPLWVKIIDTPEFQRLRYIKQLGCSYFVYPSAMHTRFEHSIGVCYLAKQLAKALQKRENEEITDKDVMCVSIAGLCHDLGHGPFSHTWEVFMEKAGNKNWKHEDMSIQIFTRIWENLVKSGKLTESEKLVDSVLVCDLIRGKNTQPKYENKKYLFEIVANKKNGVDVDKWDYFARDAYAVGTNMSFDHERLIQTAQIKRDSNDEKSICYRSTEVWNFYHMFNIRRLLHHRVYNHRVGRIIESMVVEALMHANEKLLDNGKKLSELSIEDYLKLDDSIFQKMLKLPESRKIIDRIQKRELYKLMGCAISSKKKADFNVKDIENDVKTFDRSLANDDYYVDIIEFNYGRDDDPVKNISFFNKTGEIVDDVEDITPTLMLTENFHETKISFVCRVFDDTTIQGKLTKAFERWFEDEHKTGKYKNEKDKTEQYKTKPVLRKSR